MAQPSRYTTKGPWRILVLSLVLFGLSVLVFVGMEFGYTPYLSAQIDELDGELTSLNQTFQGEREEDVFNLFSQIYNVQSLFSQQSSLSPMISFLERTTHQLVTLEAVELVHKDGVMRIEGVAPSYDVLVSQLNILGSSEQIESVVLEDSTRNEGQTTFSIYIKGIFE